MQNSASDPTLDHAELFTNINGLLKDFGSGVIVVNVYDVQIQSQWNIVTKIAASFPLKLCFKRLTCEKVNYRESIIVEYIKRKYTYFLL